MNKYRLFLFVITAAFLSGCNMAPEYSRPQAPVPAAWPGGSAYKQSEAASGAWLASNLSWRQFFTDQRLQKVIEIALENNRDLQVAALNVDRARALYGIQRAELLPTVDAVGAGIKQRIPGDLSGTGEAITVEQYSANVSAAWEIDFFGRIRNLDDAALKAYFATEQAHRSAQILLVSGVAGAYLTLAADRENLELAKSTLDTQQASRNLIQRRFEIGLSNELDIHQAQTRVDAAMVDVFLYTRLAAQDEDALNLLAGTQLPSELLPADLNSVNRPTEISAGVSSEVLLSRPDVLGAENFLKAANANIGAARAAFFPRIALTGSVGTASDELSGLFKSGSGAWSFTPQIIMPIFDARVGSGYKLTKADQKIAVAQYEKSIQQAFKEVSDALAVQGTVDGQIAAQKSLVNAAAETYRLSNARYLKGIDNYLVVIDSQRSLYAAQQGLVSLHLAKIANQVQLYAALGGGSDSTEETGP